jgi:tetratricopeptide (TPR) repeat protein
MAVDREYRDRARRAGNRGGEQAALGHIGHNLVFLGQWDEAEEILEQITLEDIRGTPDRTALTVNLALPRGDVALAREALDRAAELRTSGERQMRHGYLLLEAYVLRAEGRPREALAAALEALNIREEHSALHPFAKLAFDEALEAALELADESQVEELLGEIGRLMPSQRTPLLAAIETRGRGRLFALRGDRDAAAKELTRAVDAFRTLRGAYYLAMTLVELAELGAEKSAPLLAEAREIFERLRAKPWLERVEALERAVTV